MGLTDGGSAGAGGADEAPGPDDLVVHSAELTPIGEEAYALRTGLREPRDAAGPSTATASGTLRDAGLESAGALTTARERFEEKARLLADSCRSIEEHLGVTISSHAAQEDDIAAGLRNASQASFLEGFGTGWGDVRRDAAPPPQVGGMNADILEI